MSGAPIGRSGRRLSYDDAVHRYVLVCILGGCGLASGFFWAHDDPFMPLAVAAGVAFALAGIWVRIRAAWLMRRWPEIDQRSHK